MRKHSLGRTAVAAAFATAIALTGMPTFAAITSKAENEANPRGWSAIAGLDTRQVMEIARTLPLSRDAKVDQPYCDHAPALARTLKQEFDEKLVAQGTDGTTLWGSNVMGTWTLVLNRSDRTSCVVASGIGYSEHSSPELYYHQAGLKS
ncbi:hypothetical protein [Paracoccus aminophilus]|uniref:Uncharacterized protein n=1 Tax=Paracoccus aminophilus JCM 7686 TaxID=1367847 RepID=S5Y1D1_PARAH|nr:hypothetical protein [Paracoccus aminophilus]AGT11297.1 hypothetical protein JCM7686_pAMI5p231 [Paracoccus aminophilus JCM 7686]